MKSGAVGLMQQLLAFAGCEFTCDTAFFELFDKECPRLRQVTGIDIRDEVKYRLVTLRMQNNVLRHHLIMHASSPDTFSKVRVEVQGVASSQRGCRRCGALGDRCSEG